MAELWKKRVCKIDTRRGYHLQQTVSSAFFFLPRYFSILGFYYHDRNISLGV